MPVKIWPGGPSGAASIGRVGTLNSKNASSNLVHRAKNLIFFLGLYRHFRYMDTANLRKVIAKLRECLDQRPTTSTHVKMVLHRKYRGETLIRVWGDVFTQGVLGPMGNGVLVLVSRKDVEKKVAQLDALLRSPKKLKKLPT